MTMHCLWLRLRRLIVRTAMSACGLGPAALAQIDLCPDLGEFLGQRTL